MSQLSLFSDAGPSSIWENDTTDTRSHLQSDDLQPFTPDLSCSQQTITSAPETDFLRPLSAPASLHRVGPDRKKSYILYSDMGKDEFVIWWLQTQYASQQDQRKKIRWNAKHHSDVWKHFDQVAHHTSGEPKVMCRRCGRILDHPQHTMNGTTSMKRHLEGGICQKTANNAARQRNIQVSMQDAVCIIEWEMARRI
jgi:hypothetical protein